MSFFRLIGILFGLFQEQAQGRVLLDELPIGNGPEQDAEVLKRAQRDAQRAIQEEKQENWRLARFSGSEPRRDFESIATCSFCTS